MNQISLLVEIRDALKSIDDRLRRIDNNLNGIREYPTRDGGTVIVHESMGVNGPAGFGAGGPVPTGPFGPRLR